MIDKNFISVVVGADTDECFAIAVFETGEFTQIETPTGSPDGEPVAWWVNSPLRTGGLMINSLNNLRDLIISETGVDICANEHHVNWQEQWYTGYSPETGHHTRAQCAFCDYMESSLD